MSKEPPFFLCALPVFMRSRAIGLVRLAQRQFLHSHIPAQELEAFKNEYEKPIVNQFLAISTLKHNIAQKKVCSVSPSFLPSFPLTQRHARSEVLLSKKPKSKK